MHSEYIQSKGAFNKRFNLSKLEAGSYNFAFEIDGVVINKKFEQSIDWSPVLVASRTF